MFTRILLLSFISLVLGLGAPSVWGQEASSVNIPDNVPSGLNYEFDEFPLWAHYLRRFEIIFIGSLPFTYLLANFSYDYFFYAFSGFNNTFAPPPFGPGSSAFNDEQRTQRLISVIVSAVVLSAVVATIDLAINLNSKNKYRP